MKNRLLTIGVLTLLTLLPWTAHTGTAATTYEMTRISLAPDGTGSDGNSDSPDVSGDGRYVAFSSEATDLVDGDTNGVMDVFVYDHQTGTIDRVSLDTGEIEGDGDSSAPVISADGRYVAFSSDATNLVEGDTNGVTDVFVRDRQTGTTTRVSVATGGTQGDGASSAPAISADGRYVALSSNAANLIGDDDTNGWQDVFVHDRQTGSTTRVSVATDGTEGNNYSRAPALSGDGNWVAFESQASNLVDGDTNYGLYVMDVFVHNRQTGETTIVSIGSAGQQGNQPAGKPALSGDGRYVAFESMATTLVYDTNFAPDVFLRDRQTGTTICVSVVPGGTPGNPFGGQISDISADGRWIVFEALFYESVPGHSDLWYDIFLYDGQSGQLTELTIPADESSYAPVLSPDGTAVAFSSLASTLVPGDTDTFEDVFLWAPAAPECLVFLPLAVKEN